MASYTSKNIFMKCQSVVHVILDKIISHLFSQQYTLFFLWEQFYKNIEAQIWSEIFPKTTKNLKYDYGNFPNEGLGAVHYIPYIPGQVHLDLGTKHFKPVPDQGMKNCSQLARGYKTFSPSLFNLWGFKIILRTSTWRDKTSTQFLFSQF